MSKEYELKKKNLVAINNWCLELMKNNEHVIVCRNAYVCNGQSIHISLSKSIGIMVYGSGYYSTKFRVFDGKPELGWADSDLAGTTYGAELIYQWKEVKVKILEKIMEQKKKDFVMEHFEV